MTNVIKFPANKISSKTDDSGVRLTLKREQNGMTVVTNLKNLSNEEFLQALIGDAIMKERQELALKYINS